MLVIVPFLVLVPGLVVGRLDLTPAEPPEPEFSYCIGEACDKGKDSEA